MDWKEFRKDLDLTEEEEQEIAFEKSLIDAVIAARESKKLTQKELAAQCGMKQSVLARLENSTHSPQLRTLHTVLYHLGCTLKVVPISKQTRSRKKVSVARKKATTSNIKP